jgi:cyclic pyranopterin phosphate synthase
LGIQKVRLTGGEPLLRQDVEFLVERLSAIPGIEDLAMTSNGFLFPKKAKALRDAKLHRMTFTGEWYIRRSKSSFFRSIFQLQTCQFEG